MARATASGVAASRAVGGQGGRDPGVRVVGVRALGVRVARGQGVRVRYIHHSGSRGRPSPRSVSAGCLRIVSGVVDLKFVF